MPAVIVGSAESPYTRHPVPETTTEGLLADAFLRVLRSSGIERRNVDGLGVASFTLGPDHAIDLAWKLGLGLRWIMEDTNGGASGINLLQHALRAIEAGDASTIVLLAGDHFSEGDFEHLVENFNRATRDHHTPIPLGGPNPLFALVAQRFMAMHGLDREDLGRVAIHHRRWASRNPGAVYRNPLTMADYLAAPLVAVPLCRYDCVPVVSGADALVVTSTNRSDKGSVRIRAIRASYNADQQEGDGTSTGLTHIASELWREAGLGPSEVDLMSVYDDYTVMVLAQLVDLGFVPIGETKRFVATRLSDDAFALNTSGGQLSAGQAGAAGGMHGLVEAVRQLRGEADGRQVVGATTALVCGYGMILYRHGSCANAVVLER